MNAAFSNVQWEEEIETKGVNEMVEIRQVGNFMRK